MTALTRWLSLAALCTATIGCGPTVGDPCTTVRECGNQNCINRDFTPGGYCSRQCTADGDCPGGSVCVPNALAQGTPACMKSCASTKDCRSGYDCTQPNGASKTVCIGSAGI